MPEQGVASAHMFRRTRSKGSREDQTLPPERSQALSTNTKMGTIQRRSAWSLTGLDRAERKPAQNRIYDTAQPTSQTSRCQVAVASRKGGGLALRKHKPSPVPGRTLTLQLFQERPEVLPVVWYLLRPQPSVSWHPVHTSTMAFITLNK